MTLRIGNPLATGQTPQQLQRQYSPMAVAQRAPMGVGAASAPAVGGLQQLQQRVVKPKSFTPEQQQAGVGAYSSLMDQLKGWTTAPEAFPKGTYQTAPREAANKYDSFYTSKGFNPVYIVPFKHGVNFTAGDIQKLPEKFFAGPEDYQAFNQELSKLRGEYDSLAKDAQVEWWSNGQNVAPIGPLTVGTSELSNTFREKDWQGIAQNLANKQKELYGTIEKYLSPEEMEAYAASLASGVSADWSRPIRTEWLRYTRDGSREEAERQLRLQKQLEQMPSELQNFFHATAQGMMPKRRDPMTDEQRATLAANQQQAAASPRPRHEDYPTPTRWAP